MAREVDLTIKVDADKLIEALDKFQAQYDLLTARIERVEQALMDYDAWFEIENKFPKSV